MSLIFTYQQLYAFLLYLSISKRKYSMFLNKYDYKINAFSVNRSKIYKILKNIIYFNILENNIYVAM